MRRAVKPVYDLMRSHLMSQDFLQGDETPYQVLNEPRKPATSKSYVWVARSITCAPQQVILYAYANTRSGKFAQSLYSGFPGVLQCDVYAGYNLLGDSIIRVGCWAHVRRKFFDDFTNTKVMTSDSSYLIRWSNSNANGNTFPAGSALISASKKLNH